MDNKEFEDKYEQLISHASLQEILNLFEQKKKQYADSKMSLWFEKFKEKFTKYNSNKFIELGYKNYDSFDFFRKIFDLALKNEREDVIEYFMTNNYSSHVVYNFDLANLVVSPKILKQVLSNEKVKQKLTEYSYYAMLEKAAWKNKPESIEIIMQADAEKIQKIEKKLQEKIILQSVFFNANESFFKLIRTKEPIQFDVNLKQDDYGLENKRDNLLIIAAKNNNIEVLTYLLKSPELEVHANLVESIPWIKKLDNAQEILDTLIFDIQAPLTPELETYLKDDYLLEIFKKRDLMLKINEKLDPKGKKSKIHKI